MTAKTFNERGIFWNDFTWEKALGAKISDVAWPTLKRLAASWDDTMYDVPHLRVSTYKINGGTAPLDKLLRELFFDFQSAIENQSPENALHFFRMIKTHLDFIQKNDKRQEVLDEIQTLRGEILTRQTRLKEAEMLLETLEKK